MNIRVNNFSNGNFIQKFYSKMSKENNIKNENKEIYNYVNLYKIIAYKIDHNKEIINFNKNYLMNKMKLNINNYIKYKKNKIICQNYLQQNIISYNKLKNINSYNKLIINKSFYYQKNINLIKINETNNNIYNNFIKLKNNYFNAKFKDNRKYTNNIKALNIKRIIKYIIILILSISILFLSIKLKKYIKKLIKKKYK